MTARIPKSALAGFADFAATAASHAIEMKAWRTHMASVKADQADDGLAAPARHWPYPRPGAHPLVESAVNENDEMDYAIVDDGPTDEQILRAKKDALLGQVYWREQNVIASIVPAGKRRLLNLRENAITSNHAQWLAEHNESFLKSAASAIGLRRAPELPAEDAAYLAEQVQRRERIAAVEAAAAKAMHDIEDLTAETVDGWRMPELAP